MGIMVPETCWASNKICNKNHLLHLVGILFPHFNDGARSKSVQNNIWGGMLKKQAGFGRLDVLVLIQAADIMSNCNQWRSLSVIMKFVNSTSCTSNNKTGNYFNDLVGYSSCYSMTTLQKQPKRPTQNLMNYVRKYYTKHILCSLNSSIFPSEIVTKIFHISAIQCLLLLATSSFLKCRSHPTCLHH